MTDEQSIQELVPGAFNLVFKEGDNLNTVCARLVQYNPERFEAVALRFYSGEETLISIFAHDKLHKGRMPDNSRLPVHKFKIPCSVESFFKEIQQLNFTVTNTDYILEGMEVINK